MKEYYKSSHWRTLVKKTLEPINCECEFCGAKRWKINKKTGKKAINRPFTLHHKHYHTLYGERREDLHVTCKACHDMLHDLLRRAPAKDSRLKQLQDVAKEFFIYELGSYKEANK